MLLPVQRNGGVKVLRKGVTWVRMVGKVTETSGLGTRKKKFFFTVFAFLLPALHRVSSRTAGAASPLSSIHTCHLPGTRIPFSQTVVAKHSTRWVVRVPPSGPSAILPPSTIADLADSSLHPRSYWGWRFACHCFTSALPLLPQRMFLSVQHLLSIYFVPGIGIEHLMSH